MSERTEKIYAVTALFKSPDAIMHAAEKVRDSKYTAFDVHTPYPLHGMDGAMGLKPTKLPYVSIATFLGGSTLGFLFMTWVMAFNYPLNIGGKPFFSLPAFVPVFWANGVLIGMLCTVAALLAVFCKLPQNNCPLHDTPFMDAVSCDGYGVVIEATDENFDEQEVKAFLAEIGGTDIETCFHTTLSEGEDA